MPLVEAALVRDVVYSCEDIFDALIAKKMQLWVVPDKAIAVTQINNYPRCKVLTVVLVSGDGMEDWFDTLMDTLEAWGREAGCRYAQEYGRKGWAKAGERRGWKPTHYVMGKDLEQG